MLRVFTLAITALLILSTVEGAVQDDLTDRIKEIEMQIDRTMKDLEDGEKKLKNLKNQEEKTLAELDLIEKNIASVNQNLITIKNEESSLEKRIQTAQNRYDEAKANLDARADDYAVRLRTMYKQQKKSLLAMTFSTGSVGTSLRGLAMLRAVSESDLEVIGDLREQSRNLSEATTQLRQALNAKRQLADAKQREQITLTNSRAKKQGIVETIREDEKKQEEMNRKYREDIENAQAEKNRFIREHERTRVRVAPSLDGYDFTRYKGKLPWPVTGTVVSMFGREVDSQTKTITENRGIEIETRQNEPVLSVGRGEIVITRYLRGYGNFVMVFHPPNYYSIYGHLADILVTPGQVVDQGEVIGIAGNTGLILETTPRLVLEILREEEPENPLSWLVGDDRRAQR